MEHERRYGGGLSRSQVLNLIRNNLPPPPPPAGGGSKIFTLRPGAAATQPQVFSDWPSLYAAVSPISAEGAVIVTIDDSLAPATVTPGTYDLKNWYLWGNKFNLLGPPAILAVPTGVTFANMPLVIQQAAIQFQADGVVWQPKNGDIVILGMLGALSNAGSGTPIVTDKIGGEFAFVMDSGSQLDISGGAPLINLDGSWTHRVMSFGAWEIKNQVYSGSGLAQFDLYEGSPGISTVQSAFSGTVALNIRTPTETLTFVSESTIIGGSPVYLRPDGATSPSAPTLVYTRNGHLGLLSVEHQVSAPTGLPVIYTVLSGATTITTFSLLDNVPNGSDSIGIATASYMSAAGMPIDVRVEAPPGVTLDRVVVTVETV